MTMRVGFVGLGRMGRGIAGRILTGGHDLVVYNRTPGKTGELEEGGARVAGSIAEACRDREVVVTMVADDAALEAVSLGSGGIRDSLPDGAVHMTMGTHGVGTVQGLTAAHSAARQALVAAHAVGRPDVAAAGQIGIIVGGPPDAVGRLAPLFEVIGRRTFDAGADPASAAAVKLANNFVLGCAIEVMGEAFSLARKYGVEPQVLYELMTEGLFAAPAYKVYGQIIVDESYDQVGFSADLGLKDANLVLAAAGLARLPLPSANVLRDRLLGAVAHGDGDKDWAVVARVQARAGGLD
jgi:3-hydroxyisobutyrate dehydrogenase-like beta-hydroxyacid dehydrogenase